MVWKVFKKNKPPATSRMVLVNRQPPEELTEPPVMPRYTHNRIKTSKYTVLNFIPKNLFEQFRRIANFYFLCIAVIQLFIDSPVSPMTSILPLLFVVAVTAVKQGYEDWRRHREDNKVNNAPSRVLREGVVKDLRTRDIVVGDIVEIASNEQFPCDLLLLMSSDSEGKCSVTTANLDGETNLKLPHANLYDFKGRVEVYRGDGGPIKASLSTENLLPRGARLKNTSTVYGAAIYTGEETKMALNSKMTGNKFSTVEKSMNHFLVFFLVLLVLEIVVCTVLKYEVYDDDTMSDMWYLGVPDNTTSTTSDVIQDSSSFLVIFNYIIPISLYVTLEMQKFLGAMFIGWDDDLMCKNTGERCKCNTSDLNEELGQVQYLFTDKTGTLTENCMNFRQCSVDGVKYVDVEGCIHTFDEDDNSRTFPLHTCPASLVTFLQTLALCHTVEASPKIKAAEPQTMEEDIELSNLWLEYQASSPDEKALVEACARYGVVFEGYIKGELRLSVKGHTKTFTRLQVLEFDSDRKCMSVVVQEESGKIWLLTKGAESSVLARCCDDTKQQRLHQATLNHINDYAMLGLRTLAVGRRELSLQQYTDFASQLTRAKQMLEDREAAVREVTERMEAELQLLGATGVEDLLQEGVQETLESLRVAGIKVWVLTGDKIETAVNIAFSCGHFKRFMKILYVNGLRDHDTARHRLAQCQEDITEDSFYGLVVDGASLQLLYGNLKEEFYQVCRRCTAVVCCRMSPRQKAETVRLVKKSKESPVCAAIGDGANDVSMIQEAHVGLGVMGKEGRQAVRCSDFAFARFRFLKKVLLVHGHWYYIRVSTLVQYSFYKNVAFITPQIFFAIWNAFSTQSIYESLALTMFNITFTSLPIIIYGLFDQNLPPELLLDRAELYRNNAKNSAMSWFNFFKWNCFALWHTCVMYFGLMFVCFDDTCGLPDAQTPDLGLFGTTLVSICVFVINLKLVLEVRYFTQFFFWSVIATLLGYAVVTLVYQGFLSDFFSNYGVYWSYYRMFQSSSIMLGSMLLGVVCLLPDLVVKVCDSFTDVRVEERRRKNKDSPVTLKYYISYVNEAFYPGEESNNWSTVTNGPRDEDTSLENKHRRENGAIVQSEAFTDKNKSTETGMHVGNRTFIENETAFSNVATSLSESWTSESTVI
nr:phospholipid-transporting ATPase IF-like isoform X2 [Cherax quadricarinatus]